MSDPKTFDELLAIVKAGTFQDIVASGSPRLHELLNIGAVLFQTYSHDDQMKAMACMVGMILGTLHGEPTAAGTRLGVIITAEHRLRMFNAQATVVFNESLKARGILQPDLPPAPATEAEPARVLSIVSGKRKRKKATP